ncbi:glycoside hydrolase family 13 protein [Nocardioides sp. Kera G14]|uniref:glycoside hydrolase family 13 protein n=1 Tax=Nocardioides sp. Kera G14 TaxID=2884264 RepID=UPI001D0F5A6F|nr:glycoside hydrolase family 13 protein [Nocardioides sp. Kera G14]UDY24192.1 glycoside hydrolase family 13 protein [Nocardioides sp. Kera G14]
MDLLSEPHHDGSPLYCSTQAPELGELVTVRLRVAEGDPATRVWVRTTYDAEPIYREAERADSPTGRDSWWEATVECHSPMTHYRWLLAADDESQRWLTAAGIAEHEPSDTFDFKLSTHKPAPEWTKDAIVYQVFPDRFARSAAADERPTPHWAKPQEWDELPSYEGTDDRTWLGLYGGDLDGIIEHLDHLADLGVNVLYTTPVFPAESNHRYNASTFDQIDPLLGGDEAYQRLAEALEERGMHLIGDLTANHTGDTHEWFKEARAGDAAASAKRHWYYFHGEGPDAPYETWMGYPTLPKLNHTSAEMRAAMIEGPDSTVARWLKAPYFLDGWRIDVANMSGRLGAIDVNHMVARIIRRTIEEENPNGWLIGEHNHDASTDIDGDGWHGTMNYSGFSWPIWSWLRAETTDARPFGRPVAVQRRDGHATVQALKEWRARYGWRAALQSWSILSSHDSARIRTLVRDPKLHRVAAGLLFTLPGVPMIFAGDEIGLEGVNGEDGRRTMPWSRRDQWDTETLDFYKETAKLRHQHVALREGSLRWAYVDDDSISFLREHPDETLRITADRAAGTFTVDAV